MNTIRCSKCFMSLEELHQEKQEDFLIKIIKINGKEDYICQSCLKGW